MEKIHVLLVEDERTLSMIIKDTLEEQGFRISTAFHGEEGLRMFFAEHPEVQAFNTILAPIAKQSGIDGTSFGKLFADAYTAITEAQQRAEWQNRYQQDTDLKKDWGADYEANMATARSHITFLKERAGLTDDDLAVFASPKGMRALYAMATAHATPPAAGLDMNTISEQTWAKSVMSPDHPDHDAFTNPMNPRYKEINNRWLRANGQ